MLLAAAALGMCCASGYASGDSAAAKRGAPANRPRPTKFRVIFNCDGSGVSLDAKGDLDQWIRNVFAGLEHSHVDALLWCDGAGGNTARYDSQVLELNGRRMGKPDPDIVKWIAEGNDPPQVIVREARKRGLAVFYSFRINDIHDDFTPEEFPTFKEQHPEWMIGAGHPYGYKTALNFAVPEVRALKFAVIKEIFDKYDFDGIEIDFMRSPPFFIPGQEPAHAHILTEFLRDVRRHLDQRARERGRTIALAARVDESLEACRLDGFEVATWIKDRLVDYLILGSGVMDINVEEFTKLARGSGVLIYPCLYGWPSGYSPISAELARGLATNYWRQGADGIYTFNWFPHEPAKAYQIELLREIGEPEAMRGKAKTFAAERGSPAREYPHNWMRAALPLTLSAGKNAHIPIMVGEDLKRPPVPAMLELRIACEQLTDADQIDIALNGKPLPAGTRNGSQVVIPLAPNQIRAGRNRIGVHVEGGGVTLTAAEIHIGYGGQRGASSAASEGVKAEGGSRHRREPRHRARDRSEAGAGRCHCRRPLLQQ
jgi:hypothetical protein